MGVFNYYTILGVPIDASEYAIKQAYEDKMPQARSGLMAERYRTAYYVLTDAKRRQEYDLSLGIHKYKKTSIWKKILKGIARVLLTLLDALFSFYWCFLVVLIIYATGLIVVENDELSIELMLEYVSKWNLEIYLLALFSLVNITLHYYIRRLNRYLKHFKWEIKIQGKEGGQDE